MRKDDVVAYFLVINTPLHFSFLDFKFYLIKSERDLNILTLEIIILSIIKPPR